MYFSNPADFNDPLDSTYDKRDEKEYDKFISLQEEILMQKKEDGTISVSDVISCAQICNLFREEKEKIKQKTLRKRVCCFSSLNNDILMWSQYADSHKGV